MKIKITLLALVLGFLGLSDVNAQGYYGRSGTYISVTIGNPHPVYYYQPKYKHYRHRHYRPIYYRNHYSYRHRHMPPHMTKKYHKYKSSRHYSHGRYKYKRYERD